MPAFVLASVAPPPGESPLGRQQTLSWETAGCIWKETATGIGKPGSEAFNLSDPQSVDLYNWDVNDSMVVGLANEV